MARHSKVLIQGGSTPGGRMVVTVPTDHTWAADTARAQYNFPGAQYIWQNSWSDDDNQSRRVGTNNSGENSAGGLGGLIILGLLGMGLMGLFGDDETPKTKQYNNSQAPQVERTYTPSAPPVVRQSQPLEWSYQRPSSDNFFTNSGIQEEAIDDLGQDWDN